MTTVVLDSWAVMRTLEGQEPTASDVDELLRSDRRVAMSWINLGEVFYVVKRNTDEATANETIRDLTDSVDALLPTRPLVLVAANLKADYPMSFADAFAAATALTLDAELWTGDPELLVTDSPWRWRDCR